MAKEEIIPVSLTADGKASRGEVSVVSFSPRERSLQAAKLLIGCWLAAGVSVIIPVLHFVLVPLFFLAGPIAAWIAYRQSSAVAPSRLTCPKCGGGFGVPKSKVEWPLHAHCDGCGMFVQIAIAP